MQSLREGEKHFTSSVWIVSDTTPKKMLLIHHKKLGKWIQPGGHIEPFENPIETAIREVHEETGIDITSLRDKIHVVDTDGTFLPVPTYFMEQKIPPHKEEPMHYHLDFMYVLTVSEQALVSENHKSRGIGWFGKKDALALSIHEDTRIVINDLL